MAKNNITALGFVLGMKKPVELPINLRDFLSLDDQGIEGLEFMLKDEKLSRRIPSDVRLEYERLYFLLSSELDETLDEVEQAIKYARSNPKEIIHQLIQNSYEYEQKKN